MKGVSGEGRKELTVCYNLVCIVTGRRRDRRVHVEGLKKVCAVCKCVSVGDGGITSDPAKWWKSQFIKFEFPRKPDVMRALTLSTLDTDHVPVPCNQHDQSLS